MEHRFPWQGWYIGGMLLDDHRREKTWHYQAAGWRREANRPRLKPGCMTSGGCTHDAWAWLGPLDQGHRADHRLTEFMTDLSWPPFSLTFGLHIIAIWPAEKHTTACLHEFNFDVYQALKAWWEEANDVYACQETGNTRVSPCVSRMAGFVVPRLCLNRCNLTCLRWIVCLLTCWKPITRGYYCVRFSPIWELHSVQVSNLPLPLILEFAETRPRLPSSRSMQLNFNPPQLWNKQPSLWSSSSSNPHTHKHLHHDGHKFDALCGILLCWWATPFTSQITISINFFATIAAFDSLSSLLKSRFVKGVKRKLTRARLLLQHWSHLAILGKTGHAPKGSALIKKQKADDDLLNVGAVRRCCSRNESIFVEAFLPRWHNTSTTRENSQPVW